MKRGASALSMAVYENALAALLMIKTSVPIGVLLFCSVVGGGCSAKPSNDGSDPPLAASASRLVGGASDTGDPAVVLFETTGAKGGDCTAEFIATTVLLTAAHCTLDEQLKPLVGAGFRITMVSDVSKMTAADWIDIDPKDVHPNPAYDGNNNDIAVLVLSKPVSVTPYAFNTQPLTQADVGKAVRLIGYGSNVQGPAASGNNAGFGVKRELTTSVDDFNSGFVHIGKTGMNGCDGDSGGPALLMIGGVATIIGLDSFSNQQVDCTGGDFYQRVDTQAAFIAQFMPAAAPDAGATDDAGGTPSAPSSSGASGDPPDSGTSSGNNATTTTTTSGCAVTEHRSNASFFAPALAALALVALRRRRRQRAS